MRKLLRWFAIGVWGLAAIWVGIMSGLLSLAREVYGLYSGTAPPKDLFWSCTWIAGFLALCLAWLREHFKYRDVQEKIEQVQRPKFVIKIDQTMLGTKGLNSFTSSVFLVASIRNTGAPSAALNWKLEVTVPGGTGPKLARRQMIPSRIEMEDGETAIFSESDALYQRTLDAIPNGGFAIGVLAFLAEVRISALELPGTILKLSCDDVYGQTHDFQTTVNELGTPSLKSLSFTGLQIRLERSAADQISLVAASSEFKAPTAELSNEPLAEVSAGHTELEVRFSGEERYSAGRGGVVHYRIGVYNRGPRVAKNVEVLLERDTHHGDHSLPVVDQRWFLQLLLFLGRCDFLWQFFRFG